jgi:hypothetical protein
MHASRAKLSASFVCLAILTSSGIASAGPARRRDAITESALNPWVTVDANGRGSTVTPVLTTINGMATTLNPSPAAPTASATTTATDDSAATTTSGDTSVTQTATGSFEVCHNLAGAFVPFCTPDNGSSVWVDSTYYVTWDSSYFNSNETLYVQANYVNTTRDGPQAYSSTPLSNAWGFVSWTIKSDWLKSLPSNNVTLYIVAQGGRSVAGPTVMVTTSPTPGPYHQPQTQPPKGKDLYIALPAVGGFVILCVCGGFIFNRKHRKIGFGNVMGRRKGYGVGKSRRQRLGLSKKTGAIKLREQELTADGQYRDVPTQQEARAPGHVRGESDGLASLVATPTEEGPRSGNFFRDEMRRQEQERY